eukprot:tig00021068_g17801.t1
MWSVRLLALACLALAALAACPNSFVSCARGRLSDDCNRCLCPAGFTGIRCDSDQQPSRAAARRPAAAVPLRLQLPQPQPSLTHTRPPAVCTSDAACEGGGLPGLAEPQKCLGAFFLHQEAAFDCDGDGFMSLINSYWATLSCARAARTCRFVAYFPGRNVLSGTGTTMRFFFCDMVEAQTFLDPVTLLFTAKSASTRCKCEHPDCDITPFLEPVTKPATLTCNQTAGTCAFLQPDLPSIIGPEGIKVACPRRANCVPRSAIPAALLASAGGQAGGDGAAAAGGASNPLLDGRSSGSAWNTGLVLVLAIGVPIVAAAAAATALLALAPFPWRSRSVMAAGKVGSSGAGGAPPPASVSVHIGPSGPEGEGPLPDADGPPAQRTHSVEFDDLCCFAAAPRAGFPPFRPRPRPPRGDQLLFGVWGKAGPGELLAIMGESGAGKTTLLDCVSGRKTTGTVSGRFLLDGHPVSPAHIRAASGYVQQQQDELSALLTVREALSFAALLRMPRAVPREQKLARAEEVMRGLDLEHAADRRIGGALSRGISGGERRRVGIGQELVTSPPLLFLDEPTSGLDGYHAGQLVRSLAELGRARRTTVVLTIHQPRPSILESVSSLLLLSRGRVVFSGPAALAEPHFRERLALVAPPASHIADAALDAMTGGDEETKGRILAAAAAARAAGAGKGGADPPGATHPEVEFEVPPKGASFGQQLALLSRRAALLTARNSALLKVNAAVSLLVGILCGLAFLRIGNDLVSIQNRAGLFFFSSVFVSFASLSSLETLAAERLVFVRERAAGSYSPLAYFLTKVLFDIVPLRLFPALLFGLPLYFISGLSYEAGRFFVFLCALCLLYVCVVAICLVVSSATPSPSVASAVAGITLLLALFFGGSLVQSDSIKPWLRWVPWLSPFRYAFEIWMTTEFQGSTVSIAQEPLPSVSISGELLVSATFGLAHETVARNFVVLALMAAFHLAAAFAALLAFARERR